MANFTILFCIASLLLFTVVASHTFRLESFCASRCSRGRGGNLCRCNGFHFAGKRSQNIRNPASDDFSIWGFKTELTDDDKSEDASLEVTEDNEYGSKESPDSSDDRLQKFQSIIEKLLVRSLEAQSRHEERRRHQDIILD